MSSSTSACAGARPAVTAGPTDPSPRAIAWVSLLAVVFVVLTRLPVARSMPIETDEFGFLELVRGHWFPMHHTLFLTAARLVGLIAGDPYRGFVWLDMATSALALLSLWWWLRALVTPATAAAGTLVVAFAPVFWGYGALAGNYTAIPAVGAFLLGIAWRTWSRPRRWHAYAAAIALALGTGYRQDIGTFWLPVLIVILWKHRWRTAAVAGILFTALNVAWLAAMLHEAGGWSSYRAATADFAYSAGYLNSVWNLGLVDAPVRYMVKLGMALLWTLGPCLLFVPRGILRVRQQEHGLLRLGLLALSVHPPLASHLLVHFGVPGYAFHYVPALLALSVLGIGPSGLSALPAPSVPNLTWLQPAPLRLAAASAFLAAVFLFYPTNYNHPGWRGSFDQSFARMTRAGLRSPLPEHQPMLWRTANSFVAMGKARPKH